MLVLPIDREGRVYLHILARLEASSAQKAPTWIVAIEGIAIVHFERFRLERDFLMLDLEKFGGVVDNAIAIVVVAYGAIEQVIFQHAIKCLFLRRNRRRRVSG